MGVFVWGEKKKSERVRGGCVLARNRRERTKEREMTTMSLDSVHLSILFVYASICVSDGGEGSSWIDDGQIEEEQLFEIFFRVVMWPYQTFLKKAKQHIWPPFSLSLCVRVCLVLLVFLVGLLVYLLSFLSLVFSVLCALCLCVCVLLQTTLTCALSLYS